MTEVETVPKTNSEIAEDEKIDTSSTEDIKNHVKVENHTSERGESEYFNENTTNKEENCTEPTEPPPPPKNPWTRHLKSASGEKGTFC